MDEPDTRVEFEQTMVGLVANNRFIVKTGLTYDGLRTGASIIDMRPENAPSTVTQYGYNFSWRSECYEHVSTNVHRHDDPHLGCDEASADEISAPGVVLDVVRRATQESVRMENSNAIAIGSDSGLHSNL